MRKLSLFSILLILLCLGLLIFLFIDQDFAAQLQRLINVETPPLLFVLLMALLPGLGFPVSIFFVLAGMKFGIAGGLLAATLLIPVHMLIAYLLTHSFLRPLIHKVLKRMNYSLPAVPADKTIPFTLIFMSIPGPPYALKNFILALSGVPFGYFLGFGWPVNLLMGLPLVGLGGSALEMKPSYFAFFFILLVLGFFLFRWLKKKFTYYKALK